MSFVNRHRYESRYRGVPMEPDNTKTRTLLSIANERVRGLQTAMNLASKYGDRHPMYALYEEVLKLNTSLAEATEVGEMWRRLVVELEAAGGRRSDETTDAFKIRLADHNVKVGRMNEIDKTAYAMGKVLETMTRDEVTKRLVLTDQGMKVISPRIWNTFAVAYQRIKFAKGHVETQLDGMPPCKQQHLRKYATPSDVDSEAARKEPVEKRPESRDKKIRGLEGALWVMEGSSAMYHTELTRLTNGLRKWVADYGNSVMQRRPVSDLKRLLDDAWTGEKMKDDPDSGGGANEVEQEGQS